MEKKLSNLLFVDRNSYINILDKKFNINDLVNDNYGRQTNDRLSPLTTMIITTINEKLMKALFDQWGYNPYAFTLYPKLSNADQKYVEHYVKSSLSKGDQNVAYAGELTNSQEEKKYYELIPLANNDVLIVFEEAFFENITESKDKFQQFVLDCLCHQYKFNSNLELLMKLYVSLQINETAMNMVKLRFN